MGGAINCPGNKNRVAEFNIFVDPEAAEIVFNSGVPITLIPLDICNTTPLFMSDFEKITNEKIAPAIKAMMEPYIKAIKQFEGQEGALVYDALAGYYLINPAAFELISMDVRIETKGDITSGMSVADRRSWGEKSINTQVVSGLNREIFVKDFLNIYNQS
jgi:pyrimidine-specific ribonucleoside hydrolase